MSTNSDQVSDNQETLRTAYPRVGTSCAYCGEPITATDSFTEIEWYHLKTGARECALPEPTEDAPLLGNEIFQRLREAKRADYEHALTTIQRLAHQEPVSDGELVDATFEFVSRLDLGSPLVPLAVSLLERVMVLSGIEETPRGLRRDYFMEGINEPRT